MRAPEAVSDDLSSFDSDTSDEYKIEKRKEKIRNR